MFAHCQFHSGSDWLQEASYVDVGKNGSPIVRHMKESVCDAVRLDAIRESMRLTKPRDTVLSFERFGVTCFA